MATVNGIDHVAITAADLERSCAFYRDLLGAETVLEYAPTGVVLIRQIVIGGALLSMHQAGNGHELVARSPTVGAIDICFLWDGTIDSAIARLRDRDVTIIEGPVPRRTAGGLPSQSIYFRDPDGNLIELMAADASA